MKKVMMMIVAALVVLSGCSSEEEEERVVTANRDYVVGNWIVKEVLKDGVWRAPDEVSGSLGTVLTLASDGRMGGSGMMDLGDCLFSMETTGMVVFSGEKCPGKNYLLFSDVTERTATVEIIKSWWEVDVPWKAKLERTDKYQLLYCPTADYLRGTWVPKGHRINYAVAEMMISNTEEITGVTGKGTDYSCYFKTPSGVPAEEVATDENLREVTFDGDRWHMTLDGGTCDGQVYRERWNLILMIRDGAPMVCYEVVPTADNRGFLLCGEKVCALMGR